MTAKQHGLNWSPWDDASLLARYLEKFTKREGKNFSLGYLDSQSKGLRRGLGLRAYQRWMRMVKRGSATWKQLEKSRHVLRRHERVRRFEEWLLGKQI